MDYYLGVDQGGTKTAAVLCDETGRILGSGLAGGLLCVYNEDIEEVYLQNIRRAAQTALNQAGLGFGELRAVCGCLNGADWSFEYPVLAKTLGRGVSCGDITLLNDCIGALRGGSAARECAVICAGTGLNAAVRRADGRQKIYGYYVLSEEQGATALGKAALHAAINGYTGLCGPTALTELVLERAGYADMESLLIGTTVGKRELLPKLLLEPLLTACGLGDREALRIVERFSRRVAQFVICGARELGLEGGPLEVVYSGGVFKDNGVRIAARILHYISRALPGAYGTQARYEPVCGALLTLLDRHWGGSLPAQVSAQFEETAVRFGLIRDTTPRQQAVKGT